MRRLLLLTLYLLVCTFSSCYDRASSVEWEDYVDKETIKIMRVVEIDGFGFDSVCNLAKSTTGYKARAITICNIVFVCDPPSSDTAYKCLLVHEAWHVRSNGKSLKECRENMAEYGYEYYAKRYVEGHSGVESYLSIEEEEEAMRRQQECLRD